MNKIKIDKSLYDLLNNSEKSLKEKHIDYLIQKEDLTGVVDKTSIKLHGDPETFIGVRTNKVHTNTNRKFYIEFDYTDDKVILIWVDKLVARDFANCDILHTRQTYDIYDEFSGFEIMLFDNQENQELSKLIEIENEKFE